MLRDPSLVREGGHSHFGQWHGGRNVALLKAEGRRFGPAPDHPHGSACECTDQAGFLPVFPRPVACQLTVAYRLWPSVAVHRCTRGARGIRSGVALRFDCVEIPYGIAVVLPLLLQDHVQARASGLLVFGIVRVLARLGQHIR